VVGPGGIARPGNEHVQRHVSRPALARRISTWFRRRPGYGVNRWAGRTPYQQGTVQSLGAPVAPILNPALAAARHRRHAGRAARLSVDRQDDGGLAALSMIGYGQLNNRTGLGG